MHELASGLQRTVVHCARSDKGDAPSYLTAWPTETKLDTTDSSCVTGFASVFGTVPKSCEIVRCDARKISCMFGQLLLEALVYRVRAAEIGVRRDARKDCVCQSAPCLCVYVRQRERER